MAKAKLPHSYANSAYLSSTSVKHRYEIAQSADFLVGVFPQQKFAGVVRIPGSLGWEAVIDYFNKHFEKFGCVGREDDRAQAK